ncbi:hypothetical protein OEV82_09570 [Caldibacillus thermolactis]|jgi:hypothetical protein|uniref:Uncharacterized protein n=1 Tax=Pallidibacillus thermolactis TaxID=251051 RepID=A0ABT2WG89_9BACI|nr:hypothetical protein [Pallidibacillus thermolactis]MCU9594705.1 hypothetical protein [Pallidibacillus thermolactis]
MKAEMQGDALKNGFHKADERRNLGKSEKNCFIRGMKAKIQGEETKNCFHKADERRNLGKSEEKLFS